MPERSMVVVVMAMMMVAVVVAVMVVVIMMMVVMAMTATSRCAACLLEGFGKGGVHLFHLCYGLADSGGDGGLAVMLG